MKRISKVRLTKNKRKLKKKRLAESLIRFMELKAQLLAQLTGFPKKVYFNEKDKKALMKYSRAQLLSCAQWLIEYISKDRKGITTATCPFCLVEGSCASCPYGRNHKPCSWKGSDLDRIVEKFDYEAYPTNAQYRRILKKSFEDLVEEV